MKNVLFAIVLVSALSGCYTQLLRDQTAMPSPTADQKVSYVVDPLTKDTVKVVQQTGAVLTRDNQNCYWAQDQWGQPELRCDDSYYSNNWNTYNNYPWWYDRNVYGYDYGGNDSHRGAYYNPRYYTTGNTSGNSSDGGSQSGTPQLKGAARRTSSTAVPRDNAAASMPLIQPSSPADQPSPPPPTVQNTNPPPPPANSPAGGNDNNDRRKPTRGW